MASGGYKSDFPRNLRYLTSYYRSTSEVCRQIGFNRQQFNKYVCGLSRPSSRNMRRICDFFGVEEFEILSPHPELKKIIDIKGLRNVDDNVNPIFGGLESTILAGQKEIAAYFGFYYAYYYSFSRPGKILRSLVHVFDSNGVASYRRIERLVEQRAERNASFVYKYAGVMMLLRDRLYMIDQETLTGGEISQAVLYPSFKNRVDILTGLTVGIAGRTSREPICSRLVLEYLGPAVDLRRRLLDCQLYNPDAPNVAKTIKGLIRNRISSGEFSLRALAQ